jgi:predicted PurR-regulated permease PerM
MDPAAVNAIEDSTAPAAVSSGMGVVATSSSSGSTRGRDVARVAATATAAALAIGAIGFGLWKVRSVVILLLLALTLAAAIRPGVEWLERQRLPRPAAILSFFLGAGAVFVLFFWAAVPPAIHQIEEALRHRAAGGESVRDSTGIRHDVLVWVDRYLHQLPSGHELLHPVASYGHEATSAVVAIFFTLAATWYWVSERDRMIELLARLTPESKRERARQTYLMIDARLGTYTRLKFLMIFAVGAALSAGFYLVGLKYWLLAGGFVSLVEIVPVIGPLIGAIFVVAVGLPQSLHVAALALLVLVAVREVQSYVVNPHLMGGSVGLSPLVTLVSVSVVSILFGGFAVVLAVPFTSVVATLIDVFLLDHDPPAQPARTRRRHKAGRPPATTPAIDRSGS